MDMITVEKRDFAVKAKKLRRLGLVPGSVFAQTLQNFRGNRRSHKSYEFPPLRLVYGLFDFYAVAESDLDAVTRQDGDLFQ